MAFEGGHFGPENIQGQVKAHITLKNSFKPTQEEFLKLYPTLNIQEGYYILDDEGNIIDYLREKNYRSIVFKCTFQEGQTPVCPVQTVTEFVPKTPGKLIMVIKLMKSYVLERKHINHVRVAIQTFNPSFLKFMSSLKWILLIVSIASLVQFKNSISLLPSEFLTNEQSFLIRAGYVLLLFNEPLLSYTAPYYMGQSKFSLFKALIAIAIMQAQSCVIVYFWLGLLQKLLTRRKVLTSRTKTIMKILMLIHFAISLVTYYFITIRQAESGIANQPDPTSDYNLSVDFWKKYLYIVTAILIIWSAIKVRKIWSQIKELDSRDNLSFIFSLSFMICYLSYLGSGGLEVMNLNGPRVALLYGGTTLYIVLLQVVYTPFGFEIEEAKEKHKYANPQTKSLYENLDESEAETPASKELKTITRGTDEENRG